MLLGEGPADFLVGYIRRDPIWIPAQGIAIAAAARLFMADNLAAPKGPGYFGRQCLG